VYEAEGLLLPIQPTTPNMFSNSANTIQAYFAKALPSIYSVVTIHSNKHQQEVDIFGTKDGHNSLCTLKAEWNQYALLQYTITVSGSLMDTSLMDMEAACGHFVPEKRLLTFTKLESIQDALRCTRKYFVEDGYNSKKEEEDE
jgi:hypothetical protein